MRAFVSRGLAKRVAPRATFSRAFSGADETYEFDIARPFKTHNFDLDVSDMKVTATKSEMLKYYRDMVFYRRFEIVADTLYKQRLIRGFCHLYDGQEAVIIGMEEALKEGDSCITSYREHCHQISRGDTAGRVMAELLGRAGGSSGGKGGSMHLYRPQNNFYGGNGIVGAQVPLGTGVAFAHKYNKDNGVCVAAYGDGAANQGQIFEAMNIAALWGLPTIFLCENNEFGMGTSIERGSAAYEFYKRGDYIPGIWLDGMDVLASKKGFEIAAAYARQNKPIVVEASTYRYHGHSMSDPGTSYRTRDDVTSVRRERDCIDQTKNRILEAGWATAQELKKIDKAVRAEVDEAVEFAKASPLPQLTELESHMYTHPYLPRMVREGL
jgi:pyruvate dehydrogenase E1 component alpha subunit